MDTLSITFAGIIIIMFSAGSFVSLMRQIILHTCAAQCGDEDWPIVIQESPANARVTRDSAVIPGWRLFQDGRQPPSWILSNRK